MQTQFHWIVHIQRMLKTSPGMNTIESLDIHHAWPDLLRALLKSSPIVKDVQIDPFPAHEGTGDEVEFRLDDEVHRLVIECKSSGQPRYVRNAVGQLGVEIFRSHTLTRGLVMAPFISSASRDILLESNMGWLDLAGNARIVFPRFHLEISKADRDRWRQSARRAPGGREN